MYRSICARVNYLAMDRFDIAYSAKELCRGMQKPDEGDWRALKRMERYLRGRPRMTQKFLWQEEEGSELEVQGGIQIMPGAGRVGRRRREERHCGDGIVCATGPRLKAC